MASSTHLVACMSLLLIINVSLCSATSRTIEDVAMSARHEKWMTEHGRTYKDEVEKLYRFEVFKDNVKFIESVNAAGDRKYKLGVNRFADLTNEEFRATYTGFKPKSSLGGEVTPMLSFRYANVSSMPPSVDWRQKGAVTPVKDQGHCGCCWAFSAVASIEGIIKIKTGKLISLSEQEIVDCDITEDTNGCNGGFMTDAFKFIKKNGGLSVEDKYPYEDGQGKCRKVSLTTTSKISGYEVVPKHNEPLLLKAVANQPVSVGIDASYAFQFYTSGVFDGPCTTEMDHAITAIGYGMESDGTKYWLVKNSWGVSWGEKGFGKIERGISSVKGRCGIAMLASYPTI